METANTLWLVVNPASGSNDDEAQAALVGALAPAQVIDITTDPDLSPTALDKAGVDVLAIFTGDGSLGSILCTVEGWGGAVLVLPGGTTNLLAKALHGEEVTSEGVIEAYHAGLLSRVRRNAVAWSGGKAVCELLAGPGATWSDVREEMREGNIVAVAQTAVQAARETSGGALVRLRDPELGNPDGYGGVRLVPEAQGIVVDAYGADSIADYLKQGLALLRRNFREGPHDELGSHPVIHCETVDGAEMDLMIDGERASGQPAETFSLAELAVDLLAPA